MFSLIDNTYYIGTLNYIISFSSQLWNNTKSADLNNLYITSRWAFKSWPSTAAIWFSVLFLLAPFPFIHKLHYLLCTWFCLAHELYLVLFWKIRSDLGECYLLRGSCMTYCILYTMISQNALFIVESKYEYIINNAKVHWIVCIL